MKILSLALPRLLSENLPGILIEHLPNYKGTFVQGESRSQVYLDYAEPPPIFVQASAEPNLFGLCRAQPKMSRKRLLKTNI